MDLRQRTSMSLWFFVNCLVLVSGGALGASGPGFSPVHKQADPQALRIYRLLLPGAVAGEGKRQNLQVVFYARDSKPVRGYTIVNRFFADAYVSKLQIAPHAVAGKLQRVCFSDSEPYITETLDVSLRVSGKNVLGTYRGTSGKRSVSGQVRGLVLTGAQAAEYEEPLAAGTDWPCWRGPSGNGTAVETDDKLITDWSEVRPVWKSEVRLLSRSDSGTWLNPAYVGPIVADGRVFFHGSMPNTDGPMGGNGYFGNRRGRNGRPDPKELMDNDMVRGAEDPNQMARSLAAILWDDRVYAMDARTGAMLWSVTFPMTHQVQVGKGKGASVSTCCYANGKLLVCVADDTVHCLDAETGRILWSDAPAPERIKAWQKHRSQTIEGSGRWSEDFEMNTQASPVFAAGMFIAPRGWGSNGRGRYSLIAYHPETGRRLWTLPDAYEGASGAVRWTWGGRDYILTSDNLIDPRTGKVLWKHPLKAIAYKYTTCFVDDIMVTYGDRRKGIGIAAWRIRPTGVDKLWQYPADRSMGRTVPAAWEDCFILFPGPEGRTGKLSIVQAADGKVLHEYPTTRRHAGAAGFGGMITTNDRLLTPQETKGPGLFVLSPESARQTTLQQCLRLDHATCTTGAVSDGRLFLRAVDGIVCYDLRANSGTR